MACATTQKSGDKSKKLSAASWKKKTAAEIARWEKERKETDENPQSLWPVVVHAQEIRWVLPDPRWSRCRSWPAGLTPGIFASAQDVHA